jgi:integrase
MELKERLVGDSASWFEDYLSGLAPATGSKYRGYFLRFLEYADLTSEQLYDMHRENSKHEDTRRKKLVPKKVYDFLEHLITKEGMASGTARNAQSAIRGFFKANELDFSTNGKKLKVLVKEIPNISKPQLRKILDLTGSTRMHAVIYTARDSGLRVSDVCNIKVSDIESVLSGNVEFYTWKTKQIKTGQNASPVIGPDAINWIKLWWSYRKERGFESEYLFTTVRSIKANEFMGRKRGEVVKGEKVDPGNISQVFRTLRNKAGLKESRVSIHSLRKYHKTSLEYAGVPTSWINKMQGRRGEGSGQIYTQPNPEQLIDIYSKAYHGLSISGEATSQDIQEIQQQNIELLGRLAQLEKLVHERDKAYNQMDTDRNPTTPEELDELRTLTNTLLKAQERLDNKVDQLIHTTEPKP